MADNKVEFQFSASDDVSPVLRAIDQELAKIGASGARAGAELARGFQEAGVSIQQALKLAADPQVVQSLESHLKQLTGVNSSIKYLFEQRGGVNALILEQGKRAIAATLRDPEGMAAKGYTALQLEGMKRLAYAEAEAAGEMSALREQQAQFRVETERSAIAMENIAELEVVARKEAAARALAEKEAASAEEAQVQAAIRRASAQQPMMAYAEEGEGGVGKHFGGFLSEAAKGFAEGGPLAAASRGLASFGRGMLSMASWILEWEVIQKAMELAAGSVQHLVEEIQLAVQLSQRLGGTLGETATAFNALKNAAAFSGQSLADTNKRFDEFRSHGMTWQQAAQGAAVAGNVFRQTGVDITQAVSKAMELGAGIEDLRTVGLAKHPELLEKASAMQLEENRRQFDQMRMAREHEMRERSLQDTVTAAEREMEQRQRLEEQGFREASKLMEREMQDRHLARNRELEDEQRFIEQSMQARHKAAEWAEEDADRIHSRAISHATAFRGLAESILTGMPGVKGKSGADVTALIPAQYAAQLQRQMQAGAQALGISWEAAQALGREGVLSPGSLIQAGEEKREDQRREAARGRELESIQTGIALQKQATQERRAQQDEELKMTRAIQDTEYAMQKRNQLERTALQYAVQDQERQFQRDYQDKEWAFQVKIAQYKLEIQRLILAAYGAEIETLTTHMQSLQKGGTASSESKPGAFPESPAQKALEEKQATLRAKEKPAQQPKTPEQEALEKQNKALEDAQKAINELNSSLDNSEKKSTDANSTNTNATKDNTEKLKDLNQSFNDYLNQLKGGLGDKTKKGAETYASAVGGEISSLSAYRSTAGTGIEGYDPFRHGVLGTRVLGGGPNPFAAGTQASALYNLLQGGGAIGPSGLPVGPSGYGKTATTSPGQPQPQAQSSQEIAPGQMAKSLDAMQKATPNTAYASEKTLLLVAQLLNQVFSTT